MAKHYYEPNVAATKVAIFGQQCFWGPDGSYAVVPGVIRTKVGYTGGKMEHPTYHDLGDHTEAIHIEYDPQTINYSDLLSMFWSTHDPTMPEKTQYKSAIYYNDDKEKTLAEGTMQQEQKKYQRKIVTEILPATTFYDAEDYHQKYVLRSHQAFFKTLGLDGEALKKSHVATRLNGYLGGHGNLEQFEKECGKWGLTAEQLETVRKVIKSGVKVHCH